MKSLDFLKQADVAGALAALKAEVRAAPADAALRTFLFQLFSVVEDWDRATDQLDAAAKLDPNALMMAETYRPLIVAEKQRTEVFAGRQVPLFVGEPEAWMAQLIEALRLDSANAAEAAIAARAAALQTAPAITGTINGVSFEWIADADSRLGPILEIVINGNYRWLPFTRLQKLDFEAPVDLRDAVWTPATITFTSGGSSVGFIPTRYVGTASSGNGPCMLSRRTEWSGLGNDQYRGIGQRLWATDADDIALMDVRSVVFNPFAEA
jgi:type VI secretion system protein ImpE